MADPPPFDPVRLLETLERHSVLFVVVGAVAAITHGSPLPTEDLDVTPARDEQNLDRLANALAELHARLRVAEGEGPALPTDARLLSTAPLWTLTTDYGDLDLVFEPAGIHGFEDLRRDAAEVEVSPGVRVLVASLADVIRSKETLSRPKDRAQLPALRQTLELVREHERRELPRR